MCSVAGCGYKRLRNLSFFLLEVTLCARQCTYLLFCGIVCQCYVSKVSIMLRYCTAMCMHGQGCSLLIRTLHQYSVHYNTCFFSLGQSKVLIRQLMWQTCIHQFCIQSCMNTQTVTKCWCFLTVDSPVKVAIIKKSGSEEIMQPYLWNTIFLCLQNVGQGHCLHRMKRWNTAHKCLRSVKHFGFSKQACR